MSDKEFRVVVYKNGSPSSKILFDSLEEATDYALVQRAKFLAKVRSGKHNKFLSPALHYVAERN